MIVCKKNGYTLQDTVVNSLQDNNLQDEGMDTIYKERDVYFSSNLNDIWMEIIA